MRERPIVIIGCGKAKRDVPEGERVPIRDLYTGSLYRARLAFAEALGGPDYVLSASYGLAEADRLVRPYEADLRAWSKREREGWTSNVLAMLGARRLDKSRPIVALVAGPYAHWIHTARERGHSVTIPAEGLPLGPSIKWLREAAAALPEYVEPEPEPDYEREAAEVLAELERDEPDDGEGYELSVGALRALLGRRAA